MSTQSRSTYPVRGTQMAGNPLANSSSGHVLNLAYYVDQTAAAGGNGSIDAPFDSLTTALAETAAAEGDNGITFLIAAGDYSGEARLDITDRQPTFRALGYVVMPQIRFAATVGISVGFDGLAAYQGSIGIAPVSPGQIGLWFGGPVEATTGEIDCTMRGCYMPDAAAPAQNQEYTIRTPLDPGSDANLNLYLDHCIIASIYRETLQDASYIRVFANHSRIGGAEIGCAIDSMDATDCILSGNFDELSTTTLQLRNSHLINCGAGLNLNFPQATGTAVASRTITVDQRTFAEFQAGGVTYGNRKMSDVAESQPWSPKILDKAFPGYTQIGVLFTAHTRTVPLSEVLCPLVTALDVNPGSNWTFPSAAELDSVCDVGDEVMLIYNNAGVNAATFLAGADTARLGTVFTFDPSVYTRVRIRRTAQAGTPRYFIQLEQL